MLTRCFVKAREWQGIIFGEKLGDGRRVCSWSLRRCLLVILALGTVALFFNLNVNQWTDWNPKRFLEPNDMNWWISLKSPNVESTTDSRGATIEAVSPVSHILSTKMTDSPTQQTDGSMVPKETADPSTPVPYKSPGPYVVEYPYQYHFTINEPQKCERQRPFLVLVVPVAPHNRAHRDIVRSTWGGESLILGKTVSLVFLLGLHSGKGAEELQEQLLQESREHRDLIQSDFLDCYKNLTIKTMVMLDWLDSHCSAASYAMKIDSDVFLNLPNLIRMLANASKTDYMSGLVERGAVVHRNPRSKWYVPMELYPSPQYPRYALGLGYVVSLDLPKKLLEASRHVKALYLEDVYLGMCMQHLGIPPTDPPDRGLFYVFPVVYSACNYSRIIATTTYEHTDRVRNWVDFKKHGPHC